MDLPHAPQGDLTLSIMRDPYRTIARIADALGSDVFSGKLMMRNTVFLTGSDAARAFYSDACIRKGAAPSFLKATLFGRDGVQMLDGRSHESRKALFLSLLTEDAAESIAGRVRRALDHLADEKPERLVVQDAMQRLLTRVICDWAGIPLSDQEADLRADQLSRLFEHAAPIRLGFVKAVRDRHLADGWVADLVGGVRSGQIRPPRGSALDEVASWRNVEGDPLERPVAAVELLNILRPVVAVSCYMTFMAHAVVTHENAEAACSEHPDAFVKEVRRTAPFFPMLAARTTRPLQIGSYEVPEGMRLILDIFGTNRDARVWERPTMFRPVRFLNRQVGAFDMIPQGGGELMGHRCAGEAITLAIMETFANWLSRIRYDVPKQELDLIMGTMPALPASRMVWTNLRPPMT